MWVKNGKGLVLWLCGLAGSGKSTIGKALYEKIKQEIPNVVYLDGDELRDLLGAYGYDKQGRIEVALKRSAFAHFLSSQGLVVVVTPSMWSRSNKRRRRSSSKMYWNRMSSKII